MDKRKSEIHEHQNAIDELDLSIERQTAELGRLILQNDECEIEGIKEPFAVGKEVQAEITAKENRREEIRSSLERIRQLDEQLQELEEEDKTFDKSRSELVASLGVHAYRVYRTGSLSGESFDDIFKEINEIDTQLSQKEREVQGLTVAQDNKNIFKKIPGGAKITLLKSGIVRLEKKREAVLARVGERLLESGKVEEIPDEQVRSVTSNIKQQEDRREERIEQRESLNKEKEELNQKLEAQAGSSSPDKALKQLENEIQQQQDRLYEQHMQIGRAYLLQPSLESPKDEEQQMVLKRVHELEQQKQQHQDKVNRLQSELEIDDLQDAMKKKEDQIAKLENKISEEKQEVEQLRDELSADNNRITELRKMVEQKKQSTPEIAEEKQGQKSSASDSSSSPSSSSASAKSAKTAKSTKTSKASKSSSSTKTAKTTKTSTSADEEEQSAGPAESAKSSESMETDEQGDEKEST